MAAVRLAGTSAHVDIAAPTGPLAARAVIAAAQADPAVVAVQVDYRVRAVPIGPAALTATAGDPYRDQQWALTELRAGQLWQAGTGAGQIVAVVDTGVQAAHPDLAGQVLAGTDELTAGGDGRTDADGHGTHVAGIIAAAAGNGIGVAGLAPGARILPVRALDANGGGWDSDIAAAVIWAADHGASVVNLSLGGPDASDVMRSAVLYATGHGVVVVAAVGNERTEGNPLEYPAGYGIPGLIAVAATTSAGVSAEYSNTGPQVTLAAPGSSILSTYFTPQTGDGYAIMSGTSMATPYVSAAVAVVRSVAPALTPAQVEQVLVAQADDLGTPGRDDDTGAGLVDPLAAVCALGHCPAGVPPSPSASGTRSPSASPTVSQTATPSPSPSPAGTPAALGVRVSGPGGVVVAGTAAVLGVVVADSDGRVVGASVTAALGGRSVQAVTDASGVARLTVPTLRGGTWAVAATASGHTVGRASVLVKVASRVAVRWRGSRVTVTVAPAAGQVVTVWTRGTRGWVRRSHVAAGSGPVTLAVPKASGARVTVSAVSGLSAVTVTRP